MSATKDNSVPDQLKRRFGASIAIGDGCELADDLCIEICDGGFLALGDLVSIRRGTTIQVHDDATVLIGNNVNLGENTFISAMVGIRIGDGVGISNMCDLHDHNHQENSHRNIPLGKSITPCASGFVGAPIIIDSGVQISNKVSVTAGVRIGQNACIGAHSVVTREVRHNSLVAGAPARLIRTFDGPLRTVDNRRTLRMEWFGTSIMEHLEGYNSQMVTQAALPSIGSSVVVNEWRNRGYVQRLQLGLQAKWPYLGFVFRNHGKGGATSRDIRQTVEDTTRHVDSRIDMAFFGCGVNDAWRGFQGRHTEAVGRDEFRANYRRILQLLTQRSRYVVCMGEAPLGWDAMVDVAALNAELQAYNDIATEEASRAGAYFVDVWHPWNVAAQELGAWSGDAPPPGSLWSDGVHFSELGDALVLQVTEQFIEDNGLVSRCIGYELRERAEARAMYRHLFVRDTRRKVG